MWEYPRPPRVEAVSKPIRVIFNDVVIAETSRALRVLETSHPPVYYLPPEDVRMEHLLSTSRATHCEWKGRAAYYSVSVGDRRVENAVWSYPDPLPAFAGLRGHLAFYPSKMDGCFVGDERAEAQPGDFYGGWITCNVVGPFKGAPGTWGW